MMQGAENSGSGQGCVPPGFRFHPTDEELLYYYLRKKVCYEAIDLDVIREVDLNKLEPWDLKEKCRIGTGPQNEWYFFSHKDKKYPTGSRTNRATAAGFWKATGRDKPIYYSSSSMSRRIGMRKTLVFYTGRAPHGQKTDWIMHEYRLLIDSNTHRHDHAAPLLEQEDGWVVCRVFKKKNHSRSCLPPEMSHDHQDDDDDDDECLAVNMKKTSDELQQQHSLQGLQEVRTPAGVTSNSFGYQQLWDIAAAGSNNNYNYMHLPQLLSSESPSSSHHHHHVTVTSPFLSPAPPLTMSNMETFLRPLTYSPAHHHHHHNKLSNIAVGGDWAFLGKLLASNHQTTDDDVVGDQSKYCNLFLSQAPPENMTNMHHQHVPSSTSAQQYNAFHSTTTPSLFEP